MTYRFKTDQTAETRCSRCMGAGMVADASGLAVACPECVPRGLVRWRVIGGRIVAFCGQLDIGEVRDARFGTLWRWRCWVGLTVHPGEGCCRTAELAAAEVERRFEDFCKQSGLRPAIGGIKP